MFKRQYFYMDAAGDGATGGSGGAPAADPAGAAGGKSDPNPGGDGKGAAPGDTEKSFLEQHGNAKTPEQVAAEKASADKAASENAWVNEKFQVKKTDGSLDIEATAKKQAEAYKALETKLGSGEIAPKTADEYTFAVPDLLKDHWKPEEDDNYKAFKTEAHKLGFTQKQFEYAVGEHLRMLGEVGAGEAALSDQEIMESLRGVWKDQPTFEKNLNASYRAVAAYANPGSKDVLGSYVNLDRKFGRDPDFIAFMANIGKETKSDIPPMGSVLPDASISELQGSKAYWDKNDPKHESVKAQVDAHYQRKFK